MSDMTVPSTSKGALANMEAMREAAPTKTAGLVSDARFAAARDSRLSSAMVSASTHTVMADLKSFGELGAARQNAANSNGAQFLYFRQHMLNKKDAAELQKLLDDPSVASRKVVLTELCAFMSFKKSITPGRGPGTGQGKIVASTVFKWVAALVDWLADRVPAKDRAFWVCGEEGAVTRLMANAQAIRTRDSLEFRLMRASKLDRSAVVLVQEVLYERMLTAKRDSQVESELQIFTALNFALLAGVRVGSLFRGAPTDGDWLKTTDVCFVLSTSEGQVIPSGSFSRRYLAVNFRIFPGTKSQTAPSSPRQVEFLTASHSYSVPFLPQTTLVPLLLSRRLLKEDGVDGVDINTPEDFFASTCSRIVCKREEPLFTQPRGGSQQSTTALSTKMPRYVSSATSHLAKVAYAAGLPRGGFHAFRKAEADRIALQVAIEQTKAFFVFESGNDAGLCAHGALEEGRNFQARVEARALDAIIKHANNATDGEKVADRRMVGLLRDEKAFASWREQKKGSPLLKSLLTEYDLKRQEKEQIMRKIDRAIPAGAAGGRPYRGGPNSWASWLALPSDEVATSTQRAQLADEYNAARKAFETVRGKLRRRFATDVYRDARAGAQGAQDDTSTLAPLHGAVEEQAPSTSRLATGDGAEESEGEDDDEEAGERQEEDAWQDRLFRGEEEDEDDDNQAQAALEGLATSLAGKMGGASGSGLTTAESIRADLEKALKQSEEDKEGEGASSGMEEPEMEEWSDEDEEEGEDGSSATEAAGGDNLVTRIDDSDESTALLPQQDPALPSAIFAAMVRFFFNLLQGPAVVRDMLADMQKLGFCPFCSAEGRPSPPNIVHLRRAHDRLLASARMGIRPTQAAYRAVPAGLTQEEADCGAELLKMDEEEIKAVQVAWDRAHICETENVPEEAVKEAFLDIFDFSPYGRSHGKSK
ncbi:unnamed protein product [Jaminaea pallidilutea]